MDNFESIFRNLRDQLELDMERRNESNQRNQQRNVSNENNDDLLLNYTNNILTDYLSVMRLHQETMSFFSLNMFSLIDLLRNEQTRRREELHRRLESERRRNQVINNTVNSFNQSYRSSPSFNNLRNNRPFENTGGNNYVRQGSVFGISDISRNIRRSLPTLISPRLRSPLDARHFFGGLGPDLTNVIVRPSNEEIQHATRVFTYSNGSEIFNSRCYITMEDFEEGDELCEILHCKHTFKKEPLMNWFSENVRCPVCRFDIRDYVEENIEEPIRSISSSRNSSSESLNSSRPIINTSIIHSPTSSDSSNNNIENNTSTESQLLNTYLNENLAQDVSNGINEILENLVSDISNNNINPTLSYSLNVPLIYQEFFDPSSNMSFNNFQFNPSP